MGSPDSLVGLWESLTATLKGLESTGQDVLVDAGRLGLTGSPEPLIFGADLTLLTVRTDLVALSAARSWAETLRRGFDAARARRAGWVCCWSGTAAPTGRGRCRRFCSCR